MVSPTPNQTAHQAAFRRAFPALARSADSLGPLRTRVVYEDGRPVNIDVGGQLLYPKNAADWARDQVAECRAEPDRIILGNLGFFEPSDIQGRILKDIERFFDIDPDLPMSSAPVVDSGFFFVFGLGLGQHIPLILEEFTIRTLVIVEPFPEFVAHAMRSVPWKDVLDLAVAKGIALNIVQPADRDRSTELIDRLLTAPPGSWFLDGSYAFMHYLSEETVAAREALNELVLFKHLKPGGFFEDHVFMLENILGNFRTSTFSHLVGPSAETCDVPVFLIGSGPSLDADLDALRRCRGTAVYVSVGSGLGVLMRNGIKPDIHVETENLDLVFDVFEEWSREFDLSGIVLFGATNLVPNSLGFFDRAVLFNRPLVVLPGIASFGGYENKAAGPVAANAAFAAMADLGFRTFYLFGLDCGSRDPDRHHAEDSLYHDPGKEDIPVLSGFDIEVPANFGGTAWTNRLMETSGLVLSKSVADYPCRAFNCSDGIRIADARPKRSAEIDLPECRFDLDAFLDGKTDCLRPQTPDGFPEVWEQAPTPAECAALRSSFAAAMDAFRRQPGECHALAQAAFRAIATPAMQTGSAATLERVVGHAMYQMVRVGLFYGIRFHRDGDRTRFLDMFAAALVPVCDTMLDVVEKRLCPLRHRDESR